MPPCLKVGAIVRAPSCVNILVFALIQLLMALAVVLESLFVFLHPAMVAELVHKL